MCQLNNRTHTLGNILVQLSENGTGAVFFRSITISISTEERGEREGGIIASMR